MESQAQYFLPRIHRRNPDSSSFEITRAFSRAFCEMRGVETTVRFYKAIAGVPLDQDISLPEAGVHVVALGRFLIIALDRQLLDVNRREMVVKRPVTMISADVDSAVRSVPGPHRWKKSTVRSPPSGRQM